MSVTIAFEEARRSVVRQIGARAGAAIVDKWRSSHRGLDTGGRVELARWLDALKDISSIGSAESAGASAGRRVTSKLNLLLSDSWFQIAWAIKGKTQTR
jgi:hypothetical protein